MKLVVIYRDRSDHARGVIEFVESLRRRYPGKSVEFMDIDTRDGSHKAKVLGIMKYPAFVAVSESNQLLQLWEGLPLPLVDDVGYTLRGGQ